ncbi:MAG: T9SS type A sorting domain-containing protein [Flavobacteriaceae bacterium]|nr:T9SS type A sorting domain-containing protein [Flavobacteriaceae bacterium]
MKKWHLTFFCVLFIIFGISGQTTFNLSQSILLPAVGGDAPYNVASGLIDNDAFTDIVVGTSIGNSIFWLKNDTNGNFSVQTTPISSTMNSVGGVAIADLNNDGFNDVIATSYFDGKVVWFPNDGLGNFTVENVISTLVDGAGQIYARDIDGNSTLDLAISAYLGDEVVWFANNGSGIFGNKNIIDNTIASPGAFAVDDMDGDGDIDAVIANSVNYGTPNDSRIEVFYNDGSGVFTADTNPVADNTKDYIFSIMVADVDNDSNLDILVTDLLGAPSWFKRIPVAPGTAAYVETLISTSIANPACLDLRDLDNDSLDDFVLSSATAGAGNDIVWFKNNGAGSFGPEIMIDNTQSQAYTFTFADFDLDSDLDIASVAYNDDSVNIFINQFYTLSLENSSMEYLGIYPNPTSNFLNFKGQNNDFKVVIYDILGKKILNTTLGVDQALNVSSFESGVYILKLIDQNQTFKFVKE